MATGTKSKGGRPNKAKHLVGQKFGMLLVTEFVGMNSNSQTLLVCLCDCGNRVTIQARFLKESKRLHCGCVPWVNPRRVSKEHRASVDAKWRKENKASRSARFKKWSKKNWPALVKKKKAWKVANPEKSKAIAKRFREAHPERVASWKTKRRAQLKGARIEDVKAIEAWEIAWRSKHSVRCYWCGESFAPRKSHVDHIVALILGGSHSPANVCIACGPCNLRKNRLAVEQWNALIAEPVLL